MSGQKETGSEPVVTVGPVIRLTHHCIILEVGVSIWAHNELGVIFQVATTAQEVDVALPMI